VITHHVIQFSAGLSSWQAAERIAAQHGTENLRLLFCDTIIEDEDAYRFLIEAAAHVFGLTRGWVRDLANQAAILPLLEDGRLEERKLALIELRRIAQADIPGLIWIADGRTPWEVFRDERFLGNSRVDPCSRILKRELADAWNNENCDRANTIRAFGYMHSEQNRIDKLTRRLGGEGWRLSFPMDDAPLLTRTGLMQAAIDCGIEPPRLYYFGFPHNNCGGFC
jgi:hypothetical protein